MKQIISTLHEHILLISICFFYLMAVFVVDSLTSSKVMGDLSFYYLFISKQLVSFMLLFFSTKMLIFFTTNFHSGLACLPKFFRNIRQDYLTSDALLRFGIVYLLIPPFICSYSSLKQATPLFKSFDSDIILYKLDYFIHFNNIPWALLQNWLGHPILTRFIDYCYLAWGGIFFITLLWMAYTRRKSLRIQFLLSLVLCWIIIGNIFSTLFASVGPCYYGNITATLTNPYTPMLEYLHSIPSLQAVQIQDVLWQSYSTGRFMPLGGISAMPSMHVSIAVLMALTYRKVNPYLGFLFCLFALIIQVGSVHLGWHYAIDGYFSILATITIWRLTSILVSKNVSSEDPVGCGR